MTPKRKLKLLNSLDNDSRESYKIIEREVSKVENKLQTGELRPEQINNFYCLLERLTGLQ